MRQRHSYLEDTYRFTAETQVIDAGDGEQGSWVTLAENIFHPQGGGQPSDIGTVNGAEAGPFRVLDGDVPVVRLACGEKFEVGTDVTSAVDPELRRRHAALHTCGHVVDGFIRATGLKHKVSNHFPGQARIEFELGDTKPDLDRLAASVEESTRAAIESNRKVFATDRGDQRIITVDGLGEDPCGGTHVTSLSLLTGFSLRSVKTKGGILKVGYTVDHVE
ncbi:alanyl-tRNA synthetase [Streptomyces sp. NPDC051162]|uniref:alanyl-tRNA synthetase n=1 Tax=unclassified Streptomyces TaxID=2593676 RepID=UPI0034166192